MKVEINTQKAMQPRKMKCNCFVAGAIRRKSITTETFAKPWERMPRIWAAYINFSFKYQQSQVKKIAEETSDFRYTL